MSCEILPPLPTRKQGATVTLELDFGIALADLTDPVVVIRNRAQPVEGAVDGLGTLTQPDEDGPILYTWGPDDPEEPGVYCIEIDAEEGTWPQDSHFFARVIEQVG